MERDSPVAKLADKLGTSWPAIEKAARDSESTRSKLRSLLAQHPKLDSEDRSIVAFGSIARSEWTTGSDVDWTLLVDGFADTSHTQITHEIGERLKSKKFKSPATTGPFGKIDFSHDIIHHIGGQNDTNANTTRRILLLLESNVIGAHPEAYDRVVRGVLNRYLEEDTSLQTSRASIGRSPRFLLNDIVRFWRTMAVDFASKQRDRAGQGWAIRNVKLRMSRKLIFASGLLMCFACARDDAPAIGGAGSGTVQPLINYLQSHVSLTPLEVVASAVLAYGVSDETAVKIFLAYDDFLKTLDDVEKRERLDKLRFEDAQLDPVFNASNEVARDFQKGLDGLFFDHPPLAPLTRKYGVF